MSSPPAMPLKSSKPLAPRSLTFAQIPLPNLRRKCASPWPKPKSATTFIAKIRRSIGWNSAPRKSSGREAGLFVPTGTMGNTIAVKMHTDHGQEVICRSARHLLDWELAMLAWFSGCLVRPMLFGRRHPDWEDDSQAAISPDQRPLRAQTGLDRNREHAQHGGRRGLSDGSS